MTIDLKDVQLEIQERAIYLNNSDGVTILRATVDPTFANIKPRYIDKEATDPLWIDIAHAKYTFVQVPKQESTHE